MLAMIKQKVKRQRQRSSLIHHLKSLDNCDEIDDKLSILNYQEEAFNRDALLITLTGATALIHVSLGGTLLVLNGIGFLVLLTAHYTVPQRESYCKWTRGGLMGYTGATVASYFVVRGAAAWIDPLGMTTKLIELGLLHMLFAEQAASADSSELIFEEEQFLHQQIALP